MRIRVRHLTIYEYSRPVRLGPQVLRLRPRSDRAVELVRFALRVDPVPAESIECLDPDGNLVTRLRFENPTSRLEILGDFEVRTDGTDVDAHAHAAPAWDGRYDAALRRRLAPWIDAPAPDDEVVALARVLRAGVEHDTFAFLLRLAARLHRDIHREIRETGAPQSPGQTLRLGRGACRDLAVLFAAACRSQGLAARFVSGYQARHDAAPDTSPEPDAPAPARRHMHAWPEVYLPDAGWRGFDPTHGTPIADAHVALAAAALPEDAAPVTGAYFGDADSRLRAEIRIDAGP